MARSTFTRVLALTGALALGLAGCSGTDPGTDEPDDQAEPSGTLTMTWQSTEMQAMQPVIDAFEQAYPAVTVEVTEASIEQYFATLPTQLSSNQAPDVFLSWAGFGNAVAQRELSQFGYLTDLSDQEWVAEVPEGVLAAIQDAEGNVVVMPTSQIAFTAWYNQDALDAVGLSAPTTFDELLQFCADARSAGTVAYASGAGTVSNNSRGFQLNLGDFVDGTVADLIAPIEAGEETFSDNSAYQGAMGRYQEMIEADCMPDDPVSFDNEADINMFATGEVLGTFAGSNLKGAWLGVNPEGNFVVQPPTEKIVLYPNKGVAVNSQAENMGAALAFAAFIGQPENRALYAEGLAGALPGVPTGDPLEDPSLQLIADLQDEGNAIGFPQQYLSDPQFDGNLNASIQAMYLGTSTAQDVLAALDAQQSDWLASQ
ncbi:MAG: ABC transporter substrate-binding protein [Beutenbergiaceae bacterium]